MDILCALVDWDSRTASYFYDRAVFTESERRDLRAQLVAAARSDERIDAAALVGSAARDSEDQWSDIDLALRLAPGLSPEEVAAEWTARLYEIHGAVAYLDIWSGPTLFRVFLLASSLQIDLSFWPSDVFAESGGPFRLLSVTPTSLRVHLRGPRTPLSAWVGCMPCTPGRALLAAGRYKPST